MCNVIERYVMYLFERNSSEILSIITNVQNNTRTRTRRCHCCIPRLMWRHRLGRHAVRSHCRISTPRAYRQLRRKNGRRPRHRRRRRRRTRSSAEPWSVPHPRPPWPDAPCTYRPRNSTADTASTRPGSILPRWNSSSSSSSSRSIISSNSNPT